MAFNFNNDPRFRSEADDRSSVRMQTDPVSPPGVEPQASIDEPRGGQTPIPVTSDNPQSAAFARFASCRWQQPAEDGNAAFCTHREVKPYAGTAGFDADAWCADCQYYKLRRAPKKRQPSDDFTY